MDLELRGKVALVSGASRGLGLAIARALADEGALVAMNARSPDSLDRAAQSVPRSIAVPADVTDPSACDALVARTLAERKSLDVLVCNVGSGRSVPPGEETPMEWERVLRVNFFAATNLVRAATAALSETGGAVVCISSICGSAALGAPATYSAAKAALNSFVRGMARPLARRGVRINAVAPGNLLFAGSIWERRLREDQASVERMLAQDVALGRLGTPEEIADWVAFLASPRAAFSTGGIYVVDGGQLRGAS